MTLESLSPVPDAPPPDAPAPVRPRVCPVEQGLDVLGHRWTALIVWHLPSGPLRPAELTQRLPRITPKVLTERLRTLEALGGWPAECMPTVPTRVEYLLTAHGEALSRILDQLELWWKQGSGEATLEHLP